MEDLREELSQLCLDLELDGSGELGPEVAGIDEHGGMERKVSTRSTAASFVTLLVGEAGSVRADIGMRSRSPSL